MVASGPGTELWVTDSDIGRAVVYRADRDTILGSCATGAGAHAIAFNGDRTKAYVTNQLANTVTVVDASTRRALKTITVGSKPNGICWRRN
jgi:YVTN family beta-propeller protein